MKIALLAIIAASLTLAACQSDMTSANPRTPEALSSTNHPDVPHGDAHFEQMLDRYDLSSAK